ACNALEFPWTF
nr:immunoglobulin light chain junction region [Macaca mulatta]